MKNLCLITLKIYLFSMKVKELKDIIEETIASEVKKAILESTEEVYVIKNKKGEPIEMCTTKEEADQKLASYQAGEKGDDLIIEKGPKLSFDELDNMGEKLENMKQNSVNEKLVGNQDKIDANKDGKISKDDFEILRGEKKETECMECGSTSMEEDECLECGEMREDDGMPRDDDDAIRRLFGVSDDEDYPEGPEAPEDPMGDEEETMEGAMCEKCGKELCECGDGMMKEGKRVLRMTESELVKFISALVEETAPGLRKTMDVHKKSGKVNADGVKSSMKNVESTHLKAEGSDNPEFPHQMNAKKEKVARVNNKEEDKVVDLNRGGGLEDLNYAVEPSKEFKERVDAALKGSSKTGNSQDAANVVKSDLGEKIAKKVKDKKEAEQKEVTVSWGHSWKEPTDVNVVRNKAVNESEEKGKAILQEEIKRMKQMASYNKKTQ